MRILYLTAGAGNTICGNCLRDNALAAELIALGHDAILLPVYTPLRTDERDVSSRDVYLGGVNIYLQAKYSIFRKIPRALDRALDNPALLRWVSRFAVKTQPEDLGALTVVTAQGADGPLAKEVGRLVDAVRELRPDVIHLTNAMLAGLAPALAEAVEAPIFCSFQGEDYFLDSLPEPYRSDAFSELAKRSGSVDVYVAPCRAQAESMGPRLGLDPDDVAVVHPGVTVADLAPRERRPEAFTAGYIARIAPEKGLDQLMDALPAGARLDAAGWVSAEFEDYYASLEKRATETLAGRYRLRGYIERPDKAELLRGLGVLSVPTQYGASKGLYCLEAWACGVPVVQPRIGVFPELIEATGGGLLYDPGDPHGLANALAELAADPERAAELGALGREAVLERFTARHMAERTAALYEASR